MTINGNGKLIDLSHPKVMGILNCTADSFYDGGHYMNQNKMINRIDEMMEEGVDIIDVGGQSTRPGAKMLSSEEEWQNIVFALDYLKNNYPDQMFSVDSFWSETIKKSADYGLSIINDISAGTIDHKMFETTAQLQLPYVLMHLKGTPETMKQMAQYENVTLEVNTFLSEKLFELMQLGLNDVILDPGFGFAKTITQNYELLSQLETVGFHSKPLMVGISRKSMIYKSLHISVEKSLNGTTALNMIALEKGANILRVHDVKEAKECINIFKLMKNEYI